MGENSGAINLENRHTGERLTIRRVKRGDEIWLELKGSLPPHREGPPMHVHFAENEEGHVKSGTLSAVIDGRRVTAGPGESASIHAVWPIIGGMKATTCLSSRVMCGRRRIWTAIFRPFSRS